MSFSPASATSSCWSDSRWIRGKASCTARSWTPTRGRSHPFRGLAGVPGALEAWVTATLGQEPHPDDGPRVSEPECPGRPTPPRSTRAGGVMPSVLNVPGVYIEEIPSDVHPIAGISTSDTAFIDYFPRGPLNTAVRVASYAEFARAFGGLNSDSDASYAIAQFFANGGAVAWVVRIAGGTPKASTKMFQSGGTTSSRSPRAARARGAIRSRSPSTATPSPQPSASISPSPSTARARRRSPSGPRRSATSRWTRPTRSTSST